MLLSELGDYFSGLLSADEYRSADRALNGIQVGRGGKDVRCLAFAVDACMESFRRAAELGADALLVHHGLFWGYPLPVTGPHLDRLAFLLGKDMGLLAYHLPLDAHPELGNNAGLARALGLGGLEPFAEYHGRKIGFKGRLEPALSFEDAKVRLLRGGQAPLAILPFGPAEIRTAGVCSGGAAEEALQALDEGLDLYVTGEMSHVIYHSALEAGLNVICAGHYQTETYGVRSLAERAAMDTGLRTIFIDIPTGH